MGQVSLRKDRLRRLELAGWKSIRHTNPPLVLGDVNVLIGANGAGKSNLVSFFRMLNAMIGRRLQEFIGVSGGAESVLHLGARRTRAIDATLEFESKDGSNRYEIRLAHAAADSLVFSEEKLSFRREGQTSWKTPQVLGAGHKESLLQDEAEREDLEAKGPKRAKKRIASVTRHLLSGCRVFHFHDTSDTARVRQSSSVNANRYLQADAGNLAALLYRYQKAEPVVYRSVVDTVRLVVPFFEDFVLEPTKLNDRQILLNWRAHGSDYELGPHQLSDGSLRAIALTTLLLQPEEDLPELIILDEPELGLHPYALNVLASLLKAVSVKSQVFVATQSPTLLDEFEPEDVIVVDRCGHESVFSRLEPEKYKDWLEEYTLGQVWWKNVIGGGPGNA